jgi:preprotein translocase subunit SecA
MLSNLIKKFFGSQSDREFKKTMPQVDEINRIAAGLESLSDTELQAKTTQFRQQMHERTASQRLRYAELEEELRGDLDPEMRDRLNDEFDELDTAIRDHEADFLTEIMPEAFAMVKDACRRLLGREWDRAGEAVVWEMQPYDVQVFGGITLHQGKIAEMATGEGKTLVATMPLYLNAIPGRGAHLITHNEYLARRDAMWMGPLFNFLGLSVGIIQDTHQTGHEAFLLPAPTGIPETFDWQDVGHKEAYAADIVYGTCSQVGFDYLRDNMSVRTEEVMQRGFNYSIVDEADSILIDDARTPLILSGPVPDATNQYKQMRPLVEKLIRAQVNLVNKAIAEAEKQAKNEGELEYELGIELLKATRGMPTNRRLMKLLQEEGVKRLINRVEADYMRDKNLSEIDEALFYIVDERAHTIDLTEKGRDLLSPDEQALFILPDISLDVEAIRTDAALSDEDKILNEEEAHRSYAEKSEAVHNINQLMKAFTLFEKDVQYMVTEDGRVVIIDESTGRPQPGRRFSDGLHQALEAKEGVKLQHETQTIATITLQNLFRMYHKLSGMTGTAETEAGELWEIYKLDVAVIPTNRPIRRVDHEDQIFRTRKEKFQAIIDEVARLHKMNLPVLVGTASVEASELLSRMLTRNNIKHQLLNARYHEKEAQIVTDAGLVGAVTIATNMAGRGTDIKLAAEIIRVDRDLVESTMTLDEKMPPGETLRQHLIDNPGGLQVIGTERHEARRIDRQLRGRSGRQGDPGSSRFFLSLEDDLMRLFGSDRIAAVMDKLGAEDGEVIEHSMVTKSIERAQKKVEARNFEMRKHVLDYDDVMNQQRQVIYNRRHDVLERESAHEQIEDMIEDLVDGILVTYANAEGHPEEWDWEGLQVEFGSTFFLGFTTSTEQREDITYEDLRQHLTQTINDAYQRRVDIVGVEVFREVEKAIALHTIDTCWQEHLHEIDELKDGIGFVGVGGKNPLIEYKKGAFEIFERLIARINQETLKNLFQLRIGTEANDIERRQSPQRYNEVHRDATNMGFQGAEGAAPARPVQARPVQAGLPLGQPAADPNQITASGPGGGGEAAAKQPVRVEPKVGRNDPCPCGSGKKYKRCHGIND